MPKTPRTKPGGKTLPGKYVPGDILGQYGIDPYRYDVPVEQPIINTALNPKILESVADIEREFVLKCAKTGDPEPYAFGRTAVRPVVVSADDSDEYLVLDCMWSVGEIEAINGITAYTYALFMPDVGYKNMSDASLHEHFLGTSGQSASTIMTSLKGSYDTLANKAHSVISMQEGWNLNLFAFVDGVKVRDPRLSPNSTKAWTENPALILADMFDRCNYTMDWDSVATAANHCDEELGAYSPAITRWRVGGQILTRRDLKHWVHALAQYANCYIDVLGGYVTLVPDTNRAANHTVVATDMLENSVRVTYPGAKNTPDQVVVNVNAPIGTYSVSHGTSGGAGTISSLSMPFWDDPDCAKRKAEEVYNKSQTGRVLEFTGFDDGLSRTIGDVGTVTNSQYGLSGVTMTLVENAETSPGRWRRKYREYSAANEVDSTTVPTTNSVTLRNPYAPPDGPTPTLVGLDQDSPQNSELYLTWSGIAAWAYLKDYYVTIEDDLGTIVYEGYTASLGPSVTHTVESEVAPVAGRYYIANVYVRSITDALGAPGVAAYDPSILWDTSTIHAEEIDPNGSAFANLEFYGFGGGNADYGAYTQATKNSSAIVYEPCIDGTFAAGEYMVKFDLVSGSTNVELNFSSGQEGVWVDLYQASLDLEQTTVPSPQTAEQAVIDVTIARADSTSPITPVTSTSKTKRVTMTAMKGSSQYLVNDVFTGTNGTLLTAHTPNVDSVGSGWVSHSGSHVIQSNDCHSGINSPLTGTDAVSVIDAGTADCCVKANIDVASVDFGIIGRAANSTDYWELRVIDADQSDPALELVEWDSSSPNSTVRASITMTGVGPLNSGECYLRLLMDGNDFIGQVVVGSDSALFELTHTSSTHNTATSHGLHSYDADVEFEEFQISDLEVGIVT